MVNADRPRGLTPVRHLNGSAWNGAMNVYWHSSTDTTAIFKGDLVSTKQVMGGAGTGGPFPQVVSGATELQPFLGVAWGFGNTPSVAGIHNNLNSPNYAAASTTCYVFVIDDPFVIYECQDSSLFASTNIGSNFNATGWGSGSTTTGRSAVELITTEVANGATGGLRLIRLVPRADNELLVNADWEVLINAHTYKAEVAKTT